MAFGFQVNDSPGAKIIDDTSLLSFVIDVMTITTGTGSKSYIGISGISSITPVLFDSSNAANSHYGTNLSPGVAYDSATQTVSWHNITPPSRYILIGKGDVNASYGMFVGSLLASTISHNYEQLCFIGKATPVAAGSHTQYGSYSIAAPAGVTQIVPFVYSPSGCMVINVTKSGNTFSITCQRDSPANSQIYCFAQTSELAAPVGTHGMLVRNAAGATVFDSRYERNIIRNIDSFGFTIPSAVGVYHTPYAVDVTHPVKQKPCYCFSAFGVFAALAVGVLVPAEYLLFRHVSTTTLRLFESHQDTIGAGWLDAPTGDINALVIDGTDYD